MRKSLGVLAGVLVPFSYRALADRFEEIRESNENNNDKRETMGGGH